jgi:glycosyltransferase involved in cell wall biosynthesis
MARELQSRGGTLGEGFCRSVTVEPRSWQAVYVTTGLSRRDGGPFLSVSGLARAVAAQRNGGVAVVGVYRSDVDWATDRLQWAGIPMDAARRRLGAVEYLSTMVDRHQSSGPIVTVIHAQGLWRSASMAIEHLPRRSGSRLVISPRGMLEPWALHHHATRKRIAMALWQRRQLVEADMLHATSPEEHATIRRLGLKNPVCVIPNGIEIPAAWADRDKTAALPERPRRCVFLSRLHAKKGILMLLEAWGRIRPSGWTLDIAGGSTDGHDREIAGRIAALGLTGVRLAGELTGDDKWRFLADADLFVLPSHSENFGIAIAEAMGMGLPVITTTATPWHILQQERSGWWVEPAADALAGALREATSACPAELQSRGRRAREHVSRHYRWDSIGERMAACYDWLVGQGPLPADVHLD